jgi:glycosyltransferase involved in cell wall biosynthesis
MKILLITKHFPSKYHAGGLRIIDLYRLIKKLNNKIQIELITTDNHKPTKLESAHLNKLFNHIYWVKNSNFKNEVNSLISKSNKNFSFVDIQYIDTGALIKVAKKKWPESVIYFTPMESQIRSLFIRLKNLQFFEIKKFISTFFLACKEIYFINLADKVIYVSESDMKVSGPFCIYSECDYIDTWLSDSFLNNKNFNKSKLTHRNIIFLAYFKSATNMESLYWFCKNIHPILAGKFSDYKLNVVGEGLEKKVMEKLKSPSINFHGRVDNLFPLLKQSSIGIAPAVSGAGVRGKIHQYAIFGIPTVATSIACEDLAYKHNKSIFIANKVDEYLNYCEELLTDRKLRLDIGSNAYRACSENYTSIVAEKKVKHIYQISNRELV